MSSRLPATVLRLSLRVRLAAAIERLPEVQRLVLALRLVDGLSAREVAGALRLTARDVESRFAGAFQALADELVSSQRRVA